MRTNAEFVSRVVNDLKGLTKDGRINRRHVLAIGQDKARFLMSQKLDELTLFREEGLVTQINCFEMEEVPFIECDVVEFKNCKSIMKSKKPLPPGLFGKIGAGIIMVSSIDDSVIYEGTTPRLYKANSNFKYKRKDYHTYLVKNGHLYLPDSEVEAVNLTMFVIEKYKSVEASSCCETDEKCKSFWSFEFVCPDRFLDLVVRDTLTEMANIYRTSVEDSNPNLDVNQKGKTTE